MRDSMGVEIVPGARVAFISSVGVRVGIVSELEPLPDGEHAIVRVAGPAGRVHEGALRYRLRKPESVIVLRGAFDAACATCAALHGTVHNA